MRVTAIFNGQEYTFIYNEQTGYYEANIEAPDTGGIYSANITVVDNLSNITRTNLDVQVLKKEAQKRNIDERIAYFLDKRTFELKDILVLQDYEITIDEETNATSNVVIMQRVNAEADDFIFIKENDEIIYMRNY